VFVVTYCQQYWMKSRLTDLLKVVSKKKMKYYELTIAILGFVVSIRSWTNINCIRLVISCHKYWLSRHILDIIIVLYFRYTESEKERRHPNTFLPYGQGPRMCPGYKLATLLLKVAIVYILRNFILKPCEKTKVRYYV
jgi:hypothetical protein